MNSFEKNITFVIVSFKSSDVIEQCIKSISSNIKIIVVENSDNIFNTSSIFGFLAISLAAINIFGGFLVTQRMLAMYKKKKKDK